jgi:hypothetical protein
MALSGREVVVKVAVALVAVAACTTTPVEPVSSVAADLDTTTTTCDGSVDFDNDPLNCGTCGNVCASAFCFAGVCADDRAGHMFVIGNSYRQPNWSLDRMLGNAIFLREGVPNVAIYRGNASLEMHTVVSNALTRAAKILKPRTMYRYVARTSPALQVLMPTMQVIVIEPQPQEVDATLQALANEWSLVFDDFVRRGGIVIALDAPSATNAGTAQVLGALMPMTRTHAPGAQVYVTAHGDQVTGRVPLMFAPGEAVGYAPSGFTDAVTDDTGTVMVAHREFF